MEQLEQNLYEVLGLTPDASEDTIRRVITDKSVQLNRKIPMAATLETKRKAENELSRITEARHHLLDAGRRRTYDASLNRPILGLPGEKAANKAAAGDPTQPLAPVTSELPTTMEKAVPPPAPKPAEADDRACPMCGERIKLSAAVCRFCHTVFDAERATKFNSGNLNPPPPAPAGTAPPQPGTAPLPAAPPSNAGLSVIIAFIAIVGVGVGTMIAKQDQTKTVIQQVPAPVPTVVYVAPAASEDEPGNTNYDPAPIRFSEGEMQMLMSNWQGIKRVAFMSLDTSRLSEVLTGKALEDTTKAISWCSDPANDARYPTIELVDMSINWVNQSDAYSATAAVTIEEIKEFSVKSKCKRTRSSYVAEYQLRNEAGTWRIADIPKIETSSKSSGACQ